MATPAPTYNLEGKAEFYDGEQIDTRLRSEHMKPTAEFLRQRELAQLAKAANEAADPALTTPIQEGIAQAEQYAPTPDLQKQVNDFFTGVGYNLKSFREEAGAQKAA